MSSLVSGEPLRVLLVSPHAKQREEVGDALQGAGEHRFYWVAQPDLALTRAQGLEPHVILVDDDLTGGGTAEEATDPLRVAGLVRRLAEELPEAAIVLLAAAGGLTVAQAAVLAGARAFVPKPVRGEELVNVLRQVLGRRVVVQQAASESALGRVIVFCAPKGGTGRTTLAINTAVSLREVTRQPVVLVDADYAAPAIDVALNLRGQRDIRDLLPKLNQLDTDLISSVLATHNSGVRVLLAPPPDALDYPPTMPQVQQVTAWLKRMFPWVLVDLGLPLDEAAYAFLDAADRAVMSVLPEMVGMRNARLMLAQFDHRQYPPGKVWPLLNRENLPGGVKKDDAQAYLGRSLAFAIPNDQELATETVNRGVPMVIAHRRRPVAQAYRRFAGLLADDRKPGETVASAALAAPAPAVAAQVAAVARPAAGALAAPPYAAVSLSGPTAATGLPPATGAALPPRGAPAIAAPPPDEPRTGRRKLLLAGVAVFLIVVLLAVVAPFALRALGGSGAPALGPPSPTATVTPTGATLNPAATDQFAAANTRTAETLARLLRSSPTPEDEWPPGSPDATTAAALRAAPSPTITPSATPSPPPTAASSPTPTATATFTDTPTATATFAPTPTATATATPTPSQTLLPRAQLTARARVIARATFNAAARATSRARATATVVAARRATRAAPRVTTATAALFAGSVSPPALLAPAPNQSVEGVVTFVWQPTGPLPAGAKYEVVWWNMDEPAVAARGVAPPTTGASPGANLAPLYSSGQFRSSQVYWSVIVVLEGPYRRLMTPDQAERRVLTYSPAGPPPPPKP